MGDIKCVCVFSSMACVPGSHGRLKTEKWTRYQTHRAKAKENYRQKDRTLNIYINVSVYKSTDAIQALKCNVNTKNSFGFCGFCVYRRYVYVLVFISKHTHFCIQFVIVLLRWRTKIKRYCYVMLEVVWAHKCVAIAYTAARLPVSHDFWTAENRIKCNEMDEK